MINAAQLKKLIQLGLFKKVPVKSARILSVDGIKQELRGIPDETLRSLATLADAEIDHEKL